MVGVEGVYVRRLEGLYTKDLSILAKFSFVAIATGVRAKRTCVLLSRENRRGFRGSVYP